MINDDSIKKTICKNITKYRKLAGLSQKEFAQKLGAAPSRVSSWETGANSTDIDTLFIICDILGVSINDMCGIYPDANILLSYLEQEHIKKYRALDSHGKKMVDFTLNEEWERSTKEPSEQIQKLDKEIAEKIIPTRIINYYYRLASAGTGQIIFDTPPTKRIEIPDIADYKKADYAIGVNGNSMEPVFSDGDMLLIEMTEDINVGDIGIFRVDNESYVKKLGETELISLNPDAKNIPLNESAGCMGKVIGKLPNG